MKKYLVAIAFFLSTALVHANNYCPCDGVCWTDDGCKGSDTPYTCASQVSDAAESYCNQMDSGWRNADGSYVAE